MKSNRNLSETTETERLDSRLRGNDGWIPACAGMTGFKITVLSDGYSRLRGNDGI
ncbi:Uncharacterised protein [Neisseria meningitidis]|nr:Uncharacterised protein [Neisseria meningitidis]